MQYVSAEWVERDFGPPGIRAFGDDGSEWWIPSLDCDVPPWPEFLESPAGKAFADTAPPEPQPKEA